MAKKVNIKNIDIKKTCARSMNIKFLLNAAKIDVLQDFMLDSPDSPGIVGDELVIYNNLDNFKNTKNIIEVSAKFFIKSPDSELLLQNRKLAGSFAGRNDTMHFKLSLSGVVGVVCHRCGEPVDSDIAVDIKDNEEYELVDSADKYIKGAKPGDNISLSADEMMHVFCKDGSFDLLEFVQQELVLRLGSFSKHDVCY